MNKHEITFIEQQFNSTRHQFEMDLHKLYITKPEKKLTKDEKTEIFLKALNQKILPMSKDVCQLWDSFFSNFDWSGYEWDEEYDKKNYEADCKAYKELADQKIRLCVMDPKEHPFNKEFDEFKQALEDHLKIVG